MSSGMMLGLTWAQALNDADFARERENLQAQLREAAVKECSEEAQKDSIRRLANAVIKELQDAAEGKPITPRLSDPENNSARNEDFIDTADHLLRKMSNGTLAFSAQSIQAAKVTYQEVKGHVTDGGLPPKPVSVPPARKPKP